MKNAIAASVGAVLFLAGATWQVDQQQQNRTLAALAQGQDVQVAPDATDILQVARGLYLVKTGHADAAQVIADRLAAHGARLPRARLLYALGNAHLRVALGEYRDVTYRKVGPILTLARSEYRQAVQLDPDDWDARYNYALAAALVRDKEAAEPTAGTQMSHERAAWPDIAGAPNGMP